MLDVTLEIDGEVRVRRRLEGTLDRLQDLSPALEAIREHFYQHMDDVFASEGAATASGRWASLDERYARWKARYYGGRRTLQREDRLRSSLTHAGAPGAVSEITRDSLTVGTALRVGSRNLGRIHQEGAPRAGIPARPLIDPPDAVIDRWMELIRRHVIQKNP